jgi:DNA polymerase III delta prime subunit
MPATESKHEHAEPSRHEDILHDTLETLELTIRSARRCAYDLNSAEFTDRAKYWIKLFQSGNSCKDYRHELHRTILNLENANGNMAKLLAAWWAVAEELNVALVPGNAEMHGRMLRKVNELSEKSKQAVTEF